MLSWQFHPLTLKDHFERNHLVRPKNIPPLLQTPWDPPSPAIPRAVRAHLSCSRTYLIYHVLSINPNVGYNKGVLADAKHDIMKLFPLPLVPFAFLGGYTREAKDSTFNLLNLFCRF